MNIVVSQWWTTVTALHCGLVSILYRFTPTRFSRHDRCLWRVVGALPAKWNYRYDNRSDESSGSSGLRTDVPAQMSNVASSASITNIFCSPLVVCALESWNIGTPSSVLVHCCVLCMPTQQQEQQQEQEQEQQQHIYIYRTYTSTEWVSHCSSHRGAFTVLRQDATAVFFWYPTGVYIERKCCTRPFGLDFQRWSVAAQELLSPIHRRWREYYLYFCDAADPPWRWIFDTVRRIECKVFPTNVIHNNSSNNLAAFDSCHSRLRWRPFPNFPVPVSSLHHQHQHHRRNNWPAPRCKFHTL